MQEPEQIPDDLDLDSILANIPTLGERLSRAGSFNGTLAGLLSSDTEDDDDGADLKLEAVESSASSAPAIPPGFRGKYMPNGRKATPATYISTVRRRSVTFSKRKTGFISKIAQLVWLTGANAFCLIQQVPKIVEKKSQQNGKSTEYEVDIKSASRNNYAYGCDTWRSLYYRPEIQELIAKPFDPDAMMSNSVPYIDSNSELLVNKPSGTPGVTLSPKRTKKRPMSGSGPTDVLSPYDPTRVKVVDLKDRHSDHTDSYCTVTFNNKRKSPVDSSKLVMLDDEEKVDIEEDDEDEDDSDEKKTKSSKKRGTVVFEFAADPNKRSTTFCKRKSGLMHKAFELVGKTRCRMLLVLSYPEQEGGADLFHVYASPDWRKEALSERLISMFRAAQLIERPVLDFFAPPRPAQIYESEEARVSAERAPSYYNYRLPLFAFQHKVSASFFEEKGTKASSDAYMFFVWRDLEMTRAKKKSKTHKDDVKPEVTLRADPEIPVVHINHESLCPAEVLRGLLMDIKPQIIHPSPPPPPPPPPPAPQPLEETVAPQDPDIIPGWNEGDLFVTPKSTTERQEITFFHVWKPSPPASASLEEATAAQMETAGPAPATRSTSAPGSTVSVDSSVRRGVPAQTVRVKQEVLNGYGSGARPRQLERIIFA